MYGSAMQEFSSISVSSYEAGSLPDQLTEKSSDGWNVVSIVPTGNTITAYLSRAARSVSTPIVDDLPTIPEPEVAIPTVAEPAVATPSVPDAAPTLPTTSVSSPVDEPAGWAIHPEAVSDTIATSVTEVAATVEPAPAEQAAASAAGAPAGWYSDPSSRFELRYWDGNQWTEHVSRTGQQYTDPPVA